jgi:hypothetical protein
MRLLFQDFIPVVPKLDEPGFAAMLAEHVGQESSQPLLGYLTVG